LIMSATVRADAVAVAAVVLVLAPVVGELWWVGWPSVMNTMRSGRGWAGMLRSPACQFVPLARGWGLAPGR
jgi:hypothetical protein